MVDKISLEIGLEGGQEVASQLENIGKAGQQALGDIQNAADSVDLTSVADQFQSVQKTVQSAAAFEQVVQGVKKVEGAFESLGTAASRMATRMTKSLGLIGVAARALGPVGIALGVVGGAFVKFGDDAADALNKLTVSGAKVGLTAQQFDVLQQALGQLGISSDALNSLEQASQKLSESFGGNLLTQMERFIAQLQGMPDSVLRTQMAIATLGDALGGQVIAGLQAGTISAENFKTTLAGITPATQAQIVEAMKYQQALNQLNDAWIKLKAAFAPIVTPILGLLTQELQNLKKDLQTIRLEFAFLKAVFDVFKAAISGEDVGAAARQAAQEYKQLETQINQAGQTTSESMLTATNATLGTGQAAAQTNQQFRQTGQAGAESGQEISSAYETALQKLIQTQAEAEAVARAMETAASRARWIANLPRPEPIGAGRPNPLGFAGGGLLGGRGTGTSDSNLAWVSRGEHIMPARAVAQPGVLSFLEALRRSGGNLRGVLDGMSRFALGGLVPRAAFATGGPVGSMSNVTINFPGTPPIGGLRASADVVDQLQKAAALAQVRSGGRKPSRYS